MATKSTRNKYSTYAGLDTAPPVNWGSVANTISKQIGAFTENRKADQQAVEDSTQAAIEKLNELPDVNSQDLDTALLNSAKSQQDQLMMNMGLVRKGVIKMHDYKLRMNEMKNGMTNFKNITKVYDGWYTEAKKRVEDGTATNAHKEFIKNISSFGNLNNKKFMTNPANGQLQVVTMGYNEKTKKYDVMPDPGKEPNSFQNPGVILDLMKYDGGEAVDLDVATNKIVDNLGVIVKSYRDPKTGVTTRIEDMRQMFNPKYPERLKSLGLSDDVKTFDQFLDTYSDVLVATDEDVVQILTESGKYQLSDPTKPNYIPMRGTGNSVVFGEGVAGNPDAGLSQDLKDEARQIVNQEIASKLDSKTTKSGGYDTRDDQKKEETDAISFDIAYDVTSGGKPSNAAIETIKANNDTISNIYSDPTSDEFVIQYTDGTRKKIKKSEKEIIKDGKKQIVYDPKATAENLMAAVTPGGDVVSARQAREDYKGNDKPYTNDFNTDRDERPAANSGTGFMNTTTTVNGKVVPVTISDALSKITPDEDSAPQYTDLFKGLGVEEGTENLLNDISVIPSPRLTGSDDVIRISLPPEVMALIDKNDISLSGDTIQGEDYIEIDVEEFETGDGDDVGIKYVIDKILQASANQYNGITPNSGGTGTGVGGKYNNKQE